MSNIIVKAAEESEIIELSDAIQTILDDDGKENEPLLPSSYLSGTELKSPRARYINAILEDSNVDNTPHDGKVINSSRSFCRRLDKSATTPNRKRERHLNSVNILCRSKKRRLERRNSENSLLSKSRMSPGRHMRLYSSFVEGRMEGSGMRVVEPPPGSADSGVMVEDATGQLHPAEFVPLMVEERSGGYYVTPGSKKRTMSAERSLLTKSISSSKKGGAQDDSLTNITWLRRMSAPDVESSTTPHTAPASHETDSNSDRPPYSYSALIQFALISMPSGRMTLKDIYEWIQANFPYFKTAKLGWKNSIRHNLSLHKIFIREAPDGPGKPAFWTLKPGTVVRLPENRLFIMEGNMTTDCSHKVPQSYAVRTGCHGASIMRAADGSRVHVSPASLTARPRIKQEPSRPKPILPRGSTSCALVSLPMIVTTNPSTGQIIPSMAIASALDSQEMFRHHTTPKGAKRGRYQKIAPKAEPFNTQPTIKYDYQSPLSYDSGFGVSGLDLLDSNSMPTQRSTSRKKCRSSSLSVAPASPPSMSTPLKTLSGSTSLFENLGCLTPIEDFTNLRGGCEEFLTITPIKNSGMTPVIKDILNNISDIDLSPLGSSRQGRKLMTPKKVVVERNEFNESFNFDELFDSPEANTNAFNFSNLSFNHLFSPQK